VEIDRVFAVSCRKKRRNALLEEGWLRQVKIKEQLFRERLQHPSIKAVRSFGLWMAVEFDSFETNKKIIDTALALQIKDTYAVVGGETDAIASATLLM